MPTLIIALLRNDIKDQTSHSRATCRDGRKGGCYPRLAAASSQRSATSRGIACRCCSAALRARPLGCPGIGKEYNRLAGSVALAGERVPHGTVQSRRPVPDARRSSLPCSHTPDEPALTVARSVWNARHAPRQHNLQYAPPERARRPQASRVRQGTLQRTGRPRARERLAKCPPTTRLSHI